jgi:hypothetical protein
VQQFVFFNNFKTLWPLLKLQLKNWLFMKFPDDVRACSLKLVLWHCICIHWIAHCPKWQKSLQNSEYESFIIYSWRIPGYVSLAGILFLWLTLWVTQRHSFGGNALCWSEDASGSADAKMFAEGLLLAVQPMFLLCNSRPAFIAHFPEQRIFR